ncbi:hypothetical protein CU097_000259, partial [Rhizopus azygosporus]
CKIAKHWDSFVPHCKNAHIHGSLRHSAKCVLTSINHLQRFSFTKLPIFELLFGLVESSVLLLIIVQVKTSHRRSLHKFEGFPYLVQAEELRFLNISKGNFNCGHLQTLATLG